MSVENLEPCPFCGGEADIHYVSDGAHAQCYDCEASSSIFDGSTDGRGRDSERAYEFAFEAWNTRHESTAKLQADLAEALELALCAPNWAAALQHVHDAQAILAKHQHKESE